jgi:hypothetical protein
MVRWKKMDFQAGGRLGVMPLSLGRGLDVLSFLDSLQKNVGT